MWFLDNSINVLKVFSLLSFAYLDPGSGSFILQVLVASLVGIGFALRSYWSKLIKIFRKDQTEEEITRDENE